MRLEPLNWKNAAGIYPIELIIGCTLALLIGHERLESQKKEYYFLNSKNLLNQIFAYRGNLIWTILFCILVVFQVYLKTHLRDLLPRDVRTMLHNPMANLLKQYVVKLILKNLLLAIAFFFIDELFIMTGGSCSDKSGTHSAEKCRKNGGSWEGGFDISGHFCFLINISMILWFELQYLRARSPEEDTIRRSNIWYKVIVSIIILALATWSIILMITSIYYHTFWEKLLGCAMGYICPIVMYLLIPNHEIANRVLY